MLPTNVTDPVLFQSILDRVFSMGTNLTTAAVTAEQVRLQSLPESERRMLVEQWSEEERNLRKAECLRQQEQVRLQMIPEMERLAYLERVQEAERRDRQESDPSVAWQAGRQPTDNPNSVNGTSSVWRSCSPVRNTGGTFGWPCVACLRPIHRGNGWCIAIDVAEKR